MSAQIECALQRNWIQNTTGYVNRCGVAVGAYASQKVDLGSIPLASRTEASQIHSSSLRNRSDVEDEI